MTFMAFGANGMSFYLESGEEPDEFTLEVCPNFTGNGLYGDLVVSKEELEINIFHPDGGCGVAVLNREQAKNVVQAINIWLEKTK